LIISSIILVVCKPALANGVRFVDQLMNMNQTVEISKDFVARYLPKLSQQPSIIHIDNVDIRNKYIQIEYTQQTAVGTSFHLYTYSFEGHVISTLLKSEESDCDGGAFPFETGHWLNDSHFEKSSITINSCYDRESILEYRIQDFEITETGVINEATRTPLCSQRKYHYLSEYLLTEESLKDVSLGELQYMRNEIFASYGYIFKKSPFNKFFNACKWYTPKLDSVPIDLLSDIEHSNVQLLQATELKITPN